VAIAVAVAAVVVAAVGRNCAPDRKPGAARIS